MEEIINFLTERGVDDKNLAEMERHQVTNIVIMFLML